MTPSEARDLSTPELLCLLLERDAATISSELDCSVVQAMGLRLAAAKLIDGLIPADSAWRPAVTAS